MTNDHFYSYTHNWQPAWCGEDYVVWSRRDATVANDWEICTMRVTDVAFQETKRCYGTADGLDDAHPSCGVRNGQLRVAWAREKSQGGKARLCTMKFEDFSDVVCTPDGDYDIDYTRPTWSPGGTQIAFAANMDDELEPDDDYDIFVINSDQESLEEGIAEALTTNDDEDDDPDWGPAVLGQ
jgi:hypothetical protein